MSRVHVLVEENAWSTGCEEWEIGDAIGPSPDCLSCLALTNNLADERADIIARFTAELAKVTGDGSRKRQAGTKPPWYEDDSHEGAVFSHLTKWKRGELVDPDSGCHPNVHAAWRLLAIALKETGNIPNSE